MDVVETAALPQTIFIGTEARMRKGVDFVWRYDLVNVGSIRIYVCRHPPSITYAGDVMFIHAEPIDGQVWHVVYEGREIDHTLEQRQPVFRTRANYWQQGQREWDMNEAEGRQDYGAEWIAPQWRANGFTVSTRREM